MENFVKTTFCRWHWLLCLAMVFSLSSCKDNDKTGAPEYDSSKPVLVGNFYPETGPIATQVILEGDNFGNNAANVRVWFNEKRAAVVSAKGNRMLVLAPKLPGERCTVSVVIGSDSTWCKDKIFKYIVQTTVSTLAGGTTGATENPTGTMSLANVQFSSKTEHNMAIDANDNLFMLVTGSGNEPFYMINEENDRLKPVGTGSTFLTNSCLGYNVKDGNVYTLYTNTGMNDIALFDKSLDYTKISAGSMSWDKTIVIDNGMGSWGARKAIDMRPSDGKFYFRSGEGVLARFDPETGKGENLSSDRAFIPNGGSTYGMAFDRNDDNFIYIPAESRHCIYKYDIAQEKLTVFAGVEGSPGHLDGESSYAQFNGPCQICIDSDNNLFVADRDNHCIRKISLATGYVSTVAGMPGQAGYVNGTSDVAMFNKPKGLVVTSENILYIGDSENYAVRRLAIE